MRQNVNLHTSKCSYPLEYNICHEKFQLECNNPQNKLQLQTLFLYILMQGKRASQSEHILKHSHFLVTLGSNISETNKDGGGKFWQCDVFNSRSHLAEFEQNRWHWYITPVWTLEKITLKWIS